MRKPYKLRRRKYHDFLSSVNYGGGWLALTF
jgi:hypothetical protein